VRFQEGREEQSAGNPGTIDGELSSLLQPRGVCVCVADDEERAGRRVRSFVLDLERNARFEGKEASRPGLKDSTLAASSDELTACVSRLLRCTRSGSLLICLVGRRRRRQSKTGFDFYFQFALSP
jgi:hypothetical protein